MRRGTLLHMNITIVPKTIVIPITIFMADLVAVPKDRDCGRSSVMEG
jgi:hypothetical protein